MKETTVTNVAAKDAAASQNGNTPPTILLDLGTKSRKKVKRLRKGRGSLMARLNESIDDLRQDETIAANSQVVVVLVKQRKKNRGLFG